MNFDDATTLVATEHVRKQIFTPRVHFAQLHLLLIILIDSVNLSELLQLAFFQNGKVDLLLINT